LNQRHGLPKQVLRIEHLDQAARAGRSCPPPGGVAGDDVYFPLWMPYRCCNFLTSNSSLSVWNVLDGRALVHAGGRLCGG